MQTERYGVAKREQYKEILYGDQPEAGETGAVFAN